jgi:DNA invertase Pin-like site-specific DNA recombinase
MAVFAYARVSTDDQTLDPQLDALSKAGVPDANVFTDAAVSGTVVTQERPGYSALLARLQAGDVLTVVRLDRLGRSVVDVLLQVESLNARGVIVRALAEGVDSSTPAGRMVLGVMASLAAYERELTRERQTAGIASAQARGKHMGRPPKLNAAQQAKAVEWLKAGTPYTEIAAVLRCSLSTVRRFAAEQRCQPAKP